MIDRSRALDALDGGADLDLLVVGGGVTGAAILAEAARRGLRAALVERNDFASGTSSRSSKLVHGGLRYLKEGKIGLTRESVRERQALLRDAPGLVEPIAFLMPHYHGVSPGARTLGLGLALYDALAGVRQHRYTGSAEARALAPPLRADGLEGAHCYLDATVDDARLVLRLLAQACAAGAVAANYAAAQPLLDGDAMRAVRVTDAVSDRSFDVRPRATINATGVFADEMRAALARPPHLRPLRGSHLVVDDARLPLALSVAFSHPDDGRPVFAYPWLGRTLVGTTDLDHAAPLRDEPSIATEEMEYLLRALAFAFPSAAIAADDVVATYAGVRPIVGGAPGAPSQMSRDHAVWNERGLITITGGKLTTFRPMAMAALEAAAPSLPPFDRRAYPAFEAVTVPASPQIERAVRRRLTGRFGAETPELLRESALDAFTPVGEAPFSWAELRWSARHESVVHLDDLLLRRTRAGLLLERGGERHLERIGELCRGDLGWNASRWEDEVHRYRALWAAHYGMP